MNTPDYGPKDGDFVAYLAELERQQVITHRALAGAIGLATAKGPVSPAVRTTTPMAGATARAAVSFPSVPSAPLSPVATAEIVRSIPVGLLIVGLVLVVAGMAFNGGIFLVVIGVVMLAQAVRTVLKAAAQAATTAKPSATPARQVAAVLSAHVQRNSPKPK
jgi:hypothetical protein